MDGDASYRRFVQSCEQAELTLDPALVLPRFKEAGYECYQPDRWNAAISVAGDILGKDPASRLVEHGLITPDMVSKSVGQMTLASIINNSVKRLAGSDASISLKAGDGGRVDACNAADEYLRATIRGLETPQHVSEFKLSDDPDEDDVHPAAWTIIHDGTTERRPVGLTKTLGQVSTLTLIPWVVNGIEFPAGSLVLAEAADDTWHDAVERLAMAATMVTGVTMLRLTAFALPTRERQRFMRRSKRIRALQHLPEATPLQRIRSLAQAALPHATEI